MTLTLTLPKGEFLYNGKQVTFETPCDSEELTGLIVDGVTYDIVNALGTGLVANSFDVGAMVSVIFNLNTKKAYVQNADTNAYLEGKFNEKLDIKNKYTHPETHPASMITETDAIKMFLATERVKLAGIEEQANKYIHPSTHPASMITGLNEAVGSFGYGKSASGSYSGADTSNPNTSSESTFMNSARKITLPFAPNIMIVRSSYSNLCYALSPNIPVTGAYLSKLGLNIGNTYQSNIYCMLKNNVLYTVHSCDQPGHTYSWMIA